MDGAPGFLGRVETGRTGIYGFPGLKIETRGTRHLWWVGGWLIEICGIPPIRDEAANGWGTRLFGAG